MKELKSKYHGRFPNDVRAAYRAVHQAVATSCSDPRYKGILDTVSMQDKARLLDTSRKMLAEERDRFAHFLEGDIEHLVELRGKMRSDKFPEEWADFIVAAWLSEHCCRSSPTFFSYEPRTARRSCSCSLERVGSFTTARVCHGMLAPSRQRDK